MFDELFTNQSLQTLGALANVGILLAVWGQLRQANKRAVEEREQSALDYIVNVGRHSDEIYATLKEIPETIKQIYRDEIEQTWSNDKVLEYWFCRRLFAHVARMAAIVADSPNEQTKIYFNSWLMELRTRIEASAMMRRCVTKAVDNPAWNKHINRHIKKILLQIGDVADSP